MNRKEWIVTVGLCLLTAIVTLMVIKAPRRVPLEQCSEMYRRYHNHSGILASFIKDKQINDSTTVDITLLETTDSAGWTLLKKDFGVEELATEIMQILEPEDLKYSITLILFPKNHPGQPMDSVFLNNDAAAISWKEHVVCIFHLTSEQQYDNIVNKKVKEL